MAIVTRKDLCRAIVNFAYKNDIPFIWIAGINESITNFCFGTTACPFEINIHWGETPYNIDTLYEKITQTLLGKYGGRSNMSFAYGNKIEKVIFNDPATIVFWKNGTKTVVKCMEGEKFDPEKGLAMAIAKTVLGKTFHREFNKWLPKEETSKDFTDKMLDIIVNSGISLDEVKSCIAEGKKLAAAQKAYDILVELRDSPTTEKTLDWQDKIDELIGYLGEGLE